MFCPKCGKEIQDEAVVCVHCGRQVKEDPKTKDYNTPKTGIGVVLGLFLGIIGLIIGICIYPEGTIARKTFMKGWMITFFVCLGISIVLFIILLSVGASMFTSLY